MRPLYDARIEDLGPGDFVHVECACGHIERLTAAMLTTASVGPTTKIKTWEPGCAAESVMRRVRLWSQSAGPLGMRTTHKLTRRCRCSKQAASAFLVGWDG